MFPLGVDFRLFCMVRLGRVSKSGDGLPGPDGWPDRAKKKGAVRLLILWGLVWIVKWFFWREYADFAGWIFA